MKNFLFILIIAIFTLFSATPIWADVNWEPLLNKVTLQLQTEQWVTTKTALVNVGVNAAVADQGIDKIQTDVIQKLNQLSSKGEWHVVSFNRQLDKSGLESIQITAQARLPQSELSNLRNKAKAISKPGITFTIDDVQFVPSDEEIKQANNAMRNRLYQQAKAEIDALNKIYPDQKYYLHQINFLMMAFPMAADTMQTANYSMTKMAAAPGPQRTSAVGNKVTMEATVVLAAMSDVMKQKLNQP
jgi:hypothetical protein